MAPTPATAPGSRSGRAPTRATSSSSSSTQGAATTGCARHSGKVLDVYNWSTADGANIVQWKDGGGANQQFRLADSPDGYVRLINRNSGKAVEVEGLSTADEARVQQWSDWGGANQQWQLVRLSGTTPSPGMTPQQVVAAMQPGWNLGNSLDATGSDETSWGNPRVTEALLDNIKAQGFKSIAAAIPTQFRGDQLATMEATYADGSNAGPNNWTSFKEFDVTLAPDYPANRILLRPAFFAEVNDGAIVTLTFHFWSGARVTYRLVKNGGNVTGTA